MGTEMREAGFELVHVVQPPMGGAGGPAQPQTRPIIKNTPLRMQLECAREVMELVDHPERLLLGYTALRQVCERYRFQGVTLESLKRWVVKEYGAGTILGTRTAPHPHELSALVNKGLGNKTTALAGKPRPVNGVKTMEEFEAHLDSVLVRANLEQIHCDNDWITHKALEIAHSAEFGLADFRGGRDWLRKFLVRRDFTARRSTDNKKHVTVEQRRPLVQAFHEVMSLVQQGQLYGPKCSYAPGGDVYPPLGVGSVVAVCFREEQSTRARNAGWQWVTWKQARVVELPVLNVPVPQHGTRRQAAAAQAAASRSGEVRRDRPTKLYFACDDTTRTVNLPLTDIDKGWRLVGRPEPAAVVRENRLWEKAPLNYPARGRFALKDIFNVDQAPLEFEGENSINHVKRGEYSYGTENTAWKARQGTLQLLLCADGSVKGLTIIVKGGKDCDVDARSPELQADIVYTAERGVRLVYNPKAWLGTDENLHWLQFDYASIFDDRPEAAEIVEEGYETHLLLADHLPLQGGDDYRRIARNFARTLVVCIPKGCTDMVQPVDRNIAKIIKDGVKARFRAFKLANFERIRRPAGDGGFTASERRRLLVDWVVESVNSSLRGEIGVKRVKRAFTATGCAIDAEGSTDADIKPQHLHKETRHKNPADRQVLRSYTFNSHEVQRKPSKFERRTKEYL